MFNKKIGIDLWLNHTSRQWEFKTIHPCTVDTFGENPLETNVKHCYCFNEDKTLGYSNEYLRLKPLKDGFEKLTEFPNLKQQSDEFHFKDSKFQVEEHEILKNLRHDLRDILELDCNERLLLDEPDHLID